MDLKGFVYGTTRLGDTGVAFGERVRFVREEVLPRGLPVHTSDQYGEALAVLREAFVGVQAPKTVFKIGWSSAEEVEGQIRSQLAATGLARMDVGQLCPGGGLAAEIRSGAKAGGPSDLAALEKLKEEGLVGSYLMEVWPWSSDVAVAAIRAGRLSPLVDGLIFYLNPLQRFVSNELWDLAHEVKLPVVAMRTTAGGAVTPRADTPEYLRRRAGLVKPIFERSGDGSWTEFCARFAFGWPGVRATVGSTLEAGHLASLVGAVKGVRPLSEPIGEELAGLQRRWADAEDAKAPAWSL